LGKFSNDDSSESIETVSTLYVTDKAVLLKLVKFTTSLQHDTFNYKALVLFQFLVSLCIC